MPASWTIEVLSVSLCSVLSLYVCRLLCVLRVYVLGKKGGVFLCSPRERTAQGLFTNCIVHSRCTVCPHLGRMFMKLNRGQRRQLIQLTGLGRAVHRGRPSRCRGRRWRRAHRLRQ